MLARLHSLFTRGPAVVRECRNCGTTVASDDEACPACGTTDCLVEHEIPR